MSVLITTSIGVGDFAFEEILARNPDCHIELEPSVSVRPEIVPYAHVTGCSPDRIDAEMAAEAGVRSADVVDASEDGALVRLHWEDDGSVGLLEAFRTVPVSVLWAVGRSDGWEFELRFPSSDAVPRFHQQCLDRDITVDPKRVRQTAPESSRAVRTHGLTEKQREALVRAFDSGYFDVPRRATLTELADELGVSDTAVSERLRRGTSLMIDGTLFDSPDGRSTERDGSRSDA